ncbi:cuticle protein 2 [Folsomia candida]|uniref:Uncharacterized protein n=1 Tax=Folsomia candida TaxID=158441 RepID=A0A226D6A3_FOLCA|nr:cuticle protein 2 [Folsomia candida]OXA40683.1 hypothetical protein Fcan01_24448 [Folsomia candida]
MKAVILLMIVGASQAQFLFGNNPLWNAGSVHQDPLWAVRSASSAPHWVPQDTPEVQTAKAAHFAAHAEARSRGKRSPQYLFGNNPLWNAGAVHQDPLWNIGGSQPFVPQDTPEVQAAKAAHFAAHALARGK